MECDAHSQPTTSSSSSSSSSSSFAGAKLKFAVRSGETRRRRNRKRVKSRVNLGGALPRWRKLRGQLGLQRDADLARLLLNSCQKGGSTTSASSKNPGPLLRNISTTAHSTASQSDKIDGKDLDDDDMWETASEDATSDEDCAPSISLRPGGGKKIQED